MNEQVNSGKWKEIKGEIQKAWGKLSDDEIEKAKGNVLSLAGTIQQRFGLAQEEAASKLNGILERYKDDMDSKINAENESSKT